MKNTKNAIRSFRLFKYIRNMKMSGWLLSIILASIIAVIAVLIESSDPEKDKVSYGIKIFLIAFVTIYFGMMFLGPDSDIKHEIDVGEPPF